MVAWKIARYIGQPYDFVITGDSTGLFGLDPAILQKYLGGKTLLNANCCGLLGHGGYRSMARIFIEHNAGTRYLVFSGTVIPYKNTTENHVTHTLKTYDSPSSLYMWLPSMELRSTIAAAIFYGESSRLAMQRHFISIVNRRLMNADSHGWVPLTPSMQTSTTEECRHPPVDDSLVHGLKKLHEMTMYYNLKMIVMFNPLNCIPGPELKSTIRGVTKYLHANPDILSPLPVARIYGPSLFADNVHLNINGAMMNSHEFGTALANAMQLAESPSQVRN